MVTKAVAGYPSSSRDASLWHVTVKTVWQNFSKVIAIVISYGKSLFHVVSFIGS